MSLALTVATKSSLATSTSALGDKIDHLGDKNCDLGDKIGNLGDMTKLVIFFILRGHLKEFCSQRYLETNHLQYLDVTSLSLTTPFSNSEVPTWINSFLSSSMFNENMDLLMSRF